MNNNKANNIDSMELFKEMITFAENNKNLWRLALKYP